MSQSGLDIPQQQQEQMPLLQLLLLTLLQPLVDFVLLHRACHHHHSGPQLGCSLALLHHHPLMRLHLAQGTVEVPP
jgi:hypothetical protein